MADYVKEMCIRDSKKQRKWLLLALATDVGVLAFFKIGNAADSNILLPLGISFYTFKMISYQMDVYRGKAEAAGSFWIFGSYICMFPQLTSGPIMRYGDAQDSLEAPRCTPQQFEEGLRLLVICLLYTSCILRAGRKAWRRA